MQTREFEINGVKLHFRLDTDRHVWSVFKDLAKSPIIRLSRAKGYAVIRFIEAVMQERL